MSIANLMYANQATVGTSASKLLAGTSRKGLAITNLGTVIIYLGKDANVTTTTGYPIYPNGGSIFFDGGLEYRGDVYAISGSSGQTVAYAEFT